ncbi:MAG: biopolymer transporter ExbD [Kiritimatiellia bacterium]
MRIRRDDEGGGELINISSLLDVMFILIIFFLATTTFQQEERDAQVRLPDSGDSETLSAAPSVLIINVRADGSYLLGTIPVDLAALRGRLREAVAGGEKKVLIRGDQNALHGAVAAAVLACRQAGIHEANIGYELPR